MTITIPVPEDVGQSLRRKFGDGVDAAAREALAVELYRQSLISHGQFAEMLGISGFEADGVLKRHGVMDDITAEEVEEQVAALRAGVK